MCVEGEVVLRDRVSAACMCVCWKARLCFAWSSVCVCVCVRACVYLGAVRLCVYMSRCCPSVCVSK